MQHNLLPETLNPIGKRFLLFQLALWGSYGFIYRMAWYSYEAPPLTWLVSYIGLGLVSSSLVGILIWSMRAKPFAKQLLIALVSAIILGVVWRVTFHIIEWHVIVIFVPDNIVPYSYIHNSMMSVVYLVAWAAGYFVAAYYLKYLHQRERAVKAELLAREAEIKLLHLQISPHFLFNVLNSLDTLLLKEDVKASRDMVSKLSKFLRQTLSDEPTHNVALQEEIERTQSYLEIELVRFRDKLKIFWNIDNKLTKFVVPSLILQPLVENAIKHCVGKSMHGGTITIEATNDNSSVEIAVINKANGETSSAPLNNKGLGIGLDNIQSRLTILYGDRAALTHGPIDQNGYEVRITIASKGKENTV